MYKSRVVTFKKFADNSSIFVVAFVATLLGFSEGLRNLFVATCSYYGIKDRLIIDVVTFFVFFIFIIIIIRIYLYLSAKFIAKIILNFPAKIDCVFSSGGSGDRISDFQELRIEASEDMLVMGVGMTYFSSDLKTLGRLLDKNLKVKLLMMDANCIKSNTSEYTDNSDIIISKYHIDNYFDRKEYLADITSSCERLIGYISERKSNKNKAGSLELRVYPYLVPMNLTVIDCISDKSKMIAEFCLPFSDQRIRLKLNRKNDTVIFDEFYNNISNLWNKSYYIICDNYEGLS